MKLVVKVTAEDIALGKRCSPGFCPIALALERKGAKAPSVSPKLVNFGWRNHPKRIGLRTPQSVKIFISKFDREMPVKPFQFTLQD